MFQTTNQTRCAHSFAPLDMVQMCRDWKFCWVYTPYLFVVELDRAARCPLSWSPPIAGHHGHQRHFGRGSVDRQPVQTRFLARDINPQKNNNWLVVQSPSWKIMEFVNGKNITSHLWNGKSKSCLKPPTKTNQGVPENGKYQPTRLAIQLSIQLQAFFLFNLDDLPLGYVKHATSLLCYVPSWLCQNNYWKWW